jgi:hemoglobin
MKYQRITPASLRILIDRFHDRVREDPEIGPLLRDQVEDWEEHVERLHAFWSAVMLGDEAGKAEAALDGPPFAVEAPFFDRWIAMFEEEAGGVYEEPVATLFRTKARRVGDSLKNALFYRPGMVKAACRGLAGKPQPPAGGEPPAPATPPASGGRPPD